MGGTQKTADRKEFIEWWFSVGREPATMTQWGEKHDVSRGTLWEWKQSPEFLAALARWREIFDADFVAATRVILAKAQRGNVDAYKAIANVLGKNAPAVVDLRVDRVSYVEPNALKSPQLRVVDVTATVIPLANTTPEATEGVD